MAQEIIYVGAAPNDGTGDPLRTAYIKTNNNFTELYARAQVDPPGSLTGQLGDVAGMYAYDANYFYYCYQDFDGASQIWNQVSQIGNVSVTQIASGTSSVQIANPDDTVDISVNGVTNVGQFSDTGLSVTGTIDSTETITAGNVYSLGLVSSIGTVTAPYFVGNGAFLTGIVAVSSYSNANVATYLPTYSGSLPNLSGNVTTDGNLTGAQIYGNGSHLTGMYGNANVAVYLASSVGNIIPSANVTYSLGNSTHQWKDLWVSNSTIYINSVPVSVNSSNTLTVGGQVVLTNGSSAAVSTTGNVSAANITASSAVTSATVSASGNIVGGNISTSGNVTGAYILGNGSQITGLPANYGNTQVASYLPTYTGSFASLTGNVTTTANLSAGNVLFVSAVGTTLSTTGNITGQQIRGISVSTTGNIISPGNVIAGNVLVENGLISASGNVTGSYFVGNGSELTGMYSNSSVASYLPTYTGNITAGNITITSAVRSSIVSASGNIIGSYLIGNGSQLTGITTSLVGTVTSGNVSYVAPYTSSVSRTGNSKWSDIVSVKDFGAVGNGIADDRAAIQAAIDTQLHVYIPTGVYRIGGALGCYYAGQMITGDGRTKSIIKADNLNYSFNINDTAALVFTANEPGPSLQNIGIQFVQPETSNRASLINYPPAIYAQNVPRFQVLNCRISQGMTGIDMRQNSGGAIIDNLELSCYNYGVRIDGSLDSVRIVRLQCWPFEIAGTANESIYFDSSNHGVESGRCDDLKIEDCLFINGGVQLSLLSTAGGTTFGACSNTDFDSYGKVTMAGGQMSFVNCIWTIGDANYQAIVTTGGIMRVSNSNFQAAVALVNYMVSISGATYAQFSNNTFQNSGSPGGYIVAANGDIIVNGNKFVTPANQAWTNALIYINGSSPRATIVNNRSTDKGTGAGKFVGITNDNWHIVCNNAGIGWGYTYPGSYSQMIVANNS